MNSRATVNQTLSDWVVVEPRSQVVLSTIIETHFVTGEPVGSRTIAEFFAHKSGWSPATIRNLMSDLEHSGLVDQPHTSAGRVPTDKGYRYYVDHMISKAALSQADLRMIEAALGLDDPNSNASPDRLMERISHLLSELSENVGIVISPSLNDTLLQHLEFVRLAENRILVIVVSAPHIIQHKVIRVDEDFTQDELERTARYLNAEFSGKSLMVIRAEILALMQEEKALYDTLLRNAVLLCDKSLDEESGNAGDVYVDGASNILLKPDFTDLERLRELFRTLEEKSKLLKILTECVATDRAAASGVKVIIGREHNAPSLHDCALITASYQIGAAAIGTLGVVGPMRIEYARIMAVVNYVARLIERLSQKQPVEEFG